MELENFDHLPRIDEGDISKRLRVSERARVELPSGSLSEGGYDFFEVHVAGINSDEMVVLSGELDSLNSLLISSPVEVAPTQIKSYQPLK
ncbi:MAG TPA: hypothetical protein ENH99_01065 [Candidatus Pacearchaeota archaeon]|nr:hypothetical protein [Candidatus Pacearchaeota archaeon]